ncbi:MAG: hypothetical protein EBZ48_09670, partial [Proteobacteria bacterium]|nr:hypothetical protein [Pseudomonadota bacterium]
MALVAINFAAFGFIARFLKADFGIYHQLWISLLVVVALGLLLPQGRLTLRSVSRLSPREILGLSLQAFLIYPLGALTWTAAVQLSPLATVAFITALPVEALWGVLLFRDRIGVLGWIFLLIAVIGLWSIMAPSGLGFGPGELLALISSLSFSLGVMLFGRNDSDLSRLEASIFLSFLGALMIAVLGVMSEPLPQSLDLGPVLVVVAKGVLILLNYKLLAIGFRNLSGALAGTILMAEVLFAGMIGYLLFAETPADSTLFG